jgi:hypothetical protein
MEHRLQQLAPCHSSLPKIWLVLNEGVLVVRVETGGLEEL